MRGSGYPAHAPGVGAAVGPGAPVGGGVGTVTVVGRGTDGADVGDGAVVGAVVGPGVGPGVGEGVEGAVGELDPDGTDQLTTSVGLCSSASEAL